jgi:hypothetical protein
VNSGWKYRNEDDKVIDITNKVINTKDISYLLKSTYPEYNTDKAIIPLYGLLGTEFNKIEFVFTDIKKSDKNVALYHLKGKTKLNNTITPFDGNISFEKAIAYVPENNDMQTVVVLTGSYKLIENSNEKTAGTFIGKLKMILFTDNSYTNDILFDMDKYYEDGAVRGFVGVKKNNATDNVQSCIWGFLRFPYKFSQRFDIGAGEEIINLKYAKPWFNYSDKEWNSIINGQNKTVYLHTDQEEKGIATSDEKYIKPEEATWFVLDTNDLEKVVIEQLNINPNRINFITNKEWGNSSNEIIIVFGEIEYDNSEDVVGDDYGLTSHILIVNAITGKITYHYSENSKKNGWTSNAIFISEISIDTTLFKLTDSEVTFGIKSFFRSNSQPNPYSSTYLSLYTIKDGSIKKVLNNLVLDESSGIVNVNTCYADIQTQKKDITVLEATTSGYHDIQIKNTISNSIFGPNSEGDCEDVEKSRVEKISILKYNTSEYK